MKLSFNTDFTRLPRAGALQRSREVDPSTSPAAALELPHDERYLRRRSLALHTGERILVDLPAPVALASGDRLVLDDGRQVEITAAPEQLLEVRARDALQLTELAWHIGNRHLAAAIEPDRITVLRDHVIRVMLEGLGAAVREVVAPFEPMRGAYGGHAHGHVTGLPGDAGNCDVDHHDGDKAQGHHGAMLGTTTSND